MQRLPALLLSLAVVACTTATPVPAPALDTAARAAMVVDHNTGTVLLAKNADERLPPASMSKLMTLYMVFEALRSGRLSLDDRFPVSARAQAMGGSTMFLDTTDRVRIEDLVMGVIVQSGNDACVVLAEGLAGSEQAFAAQMTERGRQIGLTNSTFANASGWPHPEHRMSVRDLATLAGRIISDFPEYYEYFSHRSFEFDGRAPRNSNNRNPLLRSDFGGDIIPDGLKTGHTEEAGFGLVGSAKRGDRRIVVVITGLETETARKVEAEKLISWGFRDFQALPMFDSGQEVTRAEVWMGEETSIALVSEKPVVAMVPYSAGGEVKAEVRYRGPIEAPITRGKTIAELVVDVPEIGETRFPLTAVENVERGGFVRRIDASARLLLAKLLTSVQDAVE